MARTLRDPFEVGDTFYTAAWSSYAVGDYRDVVELAAEFEALGIDVVPIGQLARGARPRAARRVGRGARGSGASARAARRADRPPSMASGGYGAEAFIHEARGESAGPSASSARSTRGARTGSGSGAGRCS